MKHCHAALLVAAPLLLAITLAGCSRKAQPAAATTDTAGAAAGYGPGIREPALGDAQAAALRRQIMDEAAHAAQQRNARSAYDTRVFGAAENYRISTEGCGLLAPDQQLACRTRANADLEAGNAQTRARQPP